MEATVARIRDYMRRHLSGERVWRIGIRITTDTVSIKVYTPEKPERLNAPRDKGRAAVIEGLDAKLTAALGRKVTVEVVQSPAATAKNIRISARKCRFVVDAIRGKSVQEALAILQFVPNSAAPTVKKLLRSAIANAENNHRMDSERLEIAHVQVDEGPTLKRISPRSMGRAYRIMKRTSHITIGLAESDKVSKAAERGKGVARTAAKAPRRTAKAETSKSTAAKTGTKAKSSTKRERGGGE